MLWITEKSAVSQEIKNNLKPNSLQVIAYISKYLLTYNEIVNSLYQVDAV